VISHVWRLIDSLSNINNRNAKILLSSEFFDDIAWWVKFMNMFNGTVKFLDLKPITCYKLMHAYRVVLDIMKVIFSM
jgi:hypothetical protein